MAGKTAKTAGRQVGSEQVVPIPRKMNEKQRQERKVFWAVFGGLILVFVLLLGISLGQHATPVEPAGGSDIAASGDTTAGGGSDGATSQGQAATGQGGSDVQGQIAQLMTSIKVFQEELQKTPDDPRTLIALGNARYDLGGIYLFSLQDEPQGKKWFAEAVDAYEKALAVDGKNPAVRTDMATAAFYGGLYDKAEVAYKRAIADSPEFTQAYYNYGIFLSHVRKDYRAAITNWGKVLSLNPDPDTKKKVETLIAQSRADMGSGK